MEDGLEKNGNAVADKTEIFSKVVRAGKRTYFFDVKSTRGNDYYLTITESKKRFGEDGKFSYEKHKLFLYKEDFEKFSEGLTDAVAYIRKLSPVTARSVHNTPAEAVESKSFSDVSFDDLGTK